LELLEVKLVLIGLFIIVVLLILFGGLIFFIVND
jgi:hypothetical protein